MTKTNINTLIDRLVVTIQHSEKGSLSLVIGDPTSLSRISNLLDKQLTDKRKLNYDVSKSSTALLDFLEASVSLLDTPVIYIFGFEKIDGQQRLNFYKYLNFHRESLREAEINLIFLMDREHESEFLQFAPDLASIRSGTVYLPEQARRLAFENGLIRILDKSHKPVGAGFLISDDLAITCAHLVSVALGKHPDSQEMPREEITLDFPFLEPKGFARGTTKVWDVFADIAIIDLKGNLPESRQPVELISETNIDGHNFQTIGFPAFADNGFWSDGEIVGGGGDESVMRLRDAHSSGFQLQAGYSGAPVWDVNLQGVIGMILATERNKLAHQTQEKNITFAPVSKILEIYNPLAELVPEKLDLIRDRYLSYIRSLYNILDFSGIPQSSRAVQLSLEEVYVPLLTRPTLPKGETWERRLAGRPLEHSIALEEDVLKTEHDDVSAPVHIEDALFENNRLVVLGDPGSGKSTILKYLTLRLIEKSDVILPIPISLSAYERAVSKKKTTLQRFLAEYYTNANIAGLDLLFDNAIEKGQAVLLLDGLDEVLHDRSTLVKSVDEFANQIVKFGNRVLVTSRIVGYRFAPLSSIWAVYTLLDFNLDEIESFVKKWSVAVEKISLGDTPEAFRFAERKANSLLNSIRTNPGIARLASNPLLLTILAFVHRQSAMLPNNRVGLYDRLLETLIESWNATRGLDKTSLGISLDYESTLEVLGFLALRIHEQSPMTGVISSEEIHLWLTDYFQSRQWNLTKPQAEKRAHEFLYTVRLYSNLLVERGPGLYGFIHLTFEEMLAAYGLIQLGEQNLESTIEYIRKHIGDPSWREIILLSVGILAVKRTRRSAGEVVRAIMGINLESQEKGQNIILAGYCLADVGEKGIGANVADEVKEQLIKLHHDRSILSRIQSEAGNLLGQTGWKPYDLDDFVTIHRGKFLFGSDDRLEIIDQNYAIGKYPVTNSQYRIFIDDDGYSNQKYWTSDAWKWIQQNQISHPSFWESPKWNNPLLPVVGVSWHEAMAYCKWLGEKQARVVSLPTANQWERVARGKEGFNYPWGNKLNKEVFNSIDYWGDVGEASTTVVTQFPDGVTIDNVYDLCGNVWEWTSSLKGNLLIAYGGSWMQKSKNVNGKIQAYFAPTEQSKQIGFRVSMNFLEL